MSELAKHMRKIEEAVAKGEQDGIDVETLRAIELAAAALPGDPRDEAAARLVLKLDVYNHAELLERAVEACRSIGVEVLVCDLGETGARRPTLEELKRDRDLREIWEMLSARAGVHPEIGLRECGPGADPIYPGDLIPKYRDKWNAYPRPCLKIVPGPACVVEGW